MKPASLREMVERAMRKAVGRETVCEHSAVQFTKAIGACADAAVALIEKERREWGHAQNCHCSQMNNRRRPNGEMYDELHGWHIPHADSRCAPLPGDSTAREEEA